MNYNTGDYPLGATDDTQAPYNERFIDCPACEGTGEFDDEPCEKCGGSGEINENFINDENY